MNKFSTRLFLQLGFATLLNSTTFASDPHAEHKKHKGKEHKETTSHASSKSHAHNSDTPHWSYNGENSPENWGALSPKWASCETGKEQSPIDLRWRKPSKNRSIHFHYNSTPAQIVDNGHTIQVNFTPGSKVDLDGKIYDPVQFHFHTQSEHTLSGKHFPLELHFVHKNAAGELAVVGVMFKTGNENPWIQKLWKEIPSKKESPTKLSFNELDPSFLLPKSTTHYHYMGSLTTPPCSEGVNWNVLNTPLELSEKQLLSFQKLYPINNRPIQSINMRKPANF